MYAACNHSLKQLCRTFLGRDPFSRPSRALWVPAEPSCGRPGHDVSRVIDYYLHKCRVPCAVCRVWYSRRVRKGMRCVIPTYQCTIPISHSSSCADEIYPRVPVSVALAAVLRRASPVGSCPCRPQVPRGRPVFPPPSPPPPSSAKGKTDLPGLIGTKGACRMLAEARDDDVVFRPGGGGPPFLGWDRCVGSRMCGYTHTYIHTYIHTYMVCATDRVWVRDRHISRVCMSHLV